MKTITLPVTWQVCGFIKVEAESIEAAIEYFNESSDNIPLLEKCEYVDASFSLTDPDPELIQLYNNDGGDSQ